VTHSAELEVINGTFIDMTNLNDGSGMISVSTNSLINISDSIFQNNSALTSAIFLTKSDGVLY